MVFFGANDACLPESDTCQHVPIKEFKDNLKGIVRHSSVKAHNPRLIIVNPGPVDEYQSEQTDAAKGITRVRRTAEHTRKYAEACLELGNDLDVAVLDLWSSFMAKAGWQSGEPLAGSKAAPKNDVLAKLLRDGK